MSGSDLPGAPPATPDCDLCDYVRGKKPHAKDCPRRPENAEKRIEWKEAPRAAPPTTDPRPRTDWEGMARALYATAATFAPFAPTGDHELRSLADIIAQFSAPAAPAEGAPARVACVKCLAEHADDCPDAAPAPAADPDPDPDFAAPWTCPHCQRVHATAPSPCCPCGWPTPIPAPADPDRAAFVAAVKAYWLAEPAQEPAFREPVVSAWEALRAERDEALALTDKVLAGLEDVRSHFLAKAERGETDPMPFCGWCGLPQKDVESFKAHALTCEKSPPVQRAAAAEARAEALLQGQRDLAAQTVRIRRAALGSEGEHEGEYEGVDTEGIVRNLRASRDAAATGWAESIATLTTEVARERAARASEREELVRAALTEKAAREAAEKERDDVDQERRQTRDLLFAARAEVEGLRAALAGATTYLEEQEWSAWRSSDGGREDFVGAECCPECGGMKSDGHSSVCRLVEALETARRALAGPGADTAGAHDGARGGGETR